jgi:starch phosphorylase
MPIIKRMNDAVKAKYEDPSVQIIDEYGNVHMAHMDIHYSHSVNGVARLHTDILKETELNNFYKLYPEKFNNKTNGITFRRWVIECNPELTELITEKIGEGWKTDARQLEQLIPYAEDEAFLQCILNRKNTKKHKFSAWLEKYQGDKVDPESVYDVQIKRLHEYKRQQLNLLWAIDRYLHIKDGYRPRRPVTVFFGAKAAPAYVTAKDIIHAILTFSSIVNNDPEVSPYLKVVMLRNYNVSMAEKLIPASDISEQISLASKEASGTGNMKFMLNGAVTLGTMDGANVEIAELVGEDNIFTFGQSSEEVIEHYKNADYVAKNWYKKDKRLAAAVDFLVSEEMLEAGDRKLLKQLYDELLGRDWFMTFPDFESYCKTKDKALAAYEDRMSWAKKMAVNIAKAGYFSSDRTIDQYNNDIWHLEKDC